MVSLWPCPAHRRRQADRHGRRVGPKGRETSHPAVPPFLRDRCRASLGCCLHGSHPSGPTCDGSLSSAGRSWARSATWRVSRASTVPGSLWRMGRVLFPVIAGDVPIAGHPFWIVWVGSGVGANGRRPLARRTVATRKRPHGRARRRSCGDVGVGYDGGHHTVIAPVMEDKGSNGARARGSGAGTRVLGRFGAIATVVSTEHGHDAERAFAMPLSFTNGESASTRHPTRCSVMFLTSTCAAYGTPRACVKRTARKQALMAPGQRSRASAILSARERWPDVALAVDAERRPLRVGATGATWSPSESRGHAVPGHRVNPYRRGRASRSRE